MVARRGSATGVGALLAGALLAAPAPADEMDNLVIETASGPVQFTVELADTPDERAQGLMFRDALAPNAGMLFIYPRDQIISMWMKNTLIPLDMLFIGGDGRVLGIAERTVPLSLHSISSEGPARAVLEVNGGTAARHGIRPGDRVHHPLLDGAAE